MTILIFSKRALQQLSKPHTEVSLFSKLNFSKSAFCASDLPMQVLIFFSKLALCLSKPYTVVSISSKPGIRASKFLKTISIFSRLIIWPLLPPTVVLIFQELALRA